MDALGSNVRASPTTNSVAPYCQYSPIVLEGSLEVRRHMLLFFWFPGSFYITTKAIFLSQGSLNSLTNYRHFQGVHIPNTAIV